jgi:hypothetical protein
MLIHCPECGTACPGDSKVYMAFQRRTAGCLTDVLLLMCVLFLAVIAMFCVTSCLGGACLFLV